MSNEQNADKKLEDEKKQIEIEREKVALEKDRVALEKEKVSAAKEAREAAFPPGVSTPPTGKIETNDKFGYIAELAAYRGIRTCAEDISKKVNEKLPNGINRILIVDTLDFSPGDYLLLLIKSQIDTFKNNFTRLDEKLDQLTRPEYNIPTSRILDSASVVTAAGIITAISALKSAVSLAADVTSYFRANYNGKGRDIKVSDDSLKASVAGEITGGKSYILNFGHITTSAILESLNQLLEHARLTEVKKESLHKQVEVDKAKLAESGATNPDLKTKVTDAETTLTAWQILNTSLDNYLKSITSSEGQQQPALVSAVLREQVTTKEITHLLYLKVISSGGDVISKERAIPPAGKVGFIGGGVVSYMLADVTGSIISADTLLGLSQVEYDIDDDEIDMIREIPTTGQPPIEKTRWQKIRDIF